MQRRCGWIEAGSRVVLEQVVTPGGEHAGNVRASRRMITSNDTVADRHLATSRGAIILDRNVSSDRCLIAGEGTEGDGKRAAGIADAPAIAVRSRGRIAGDSAVSESERAAIRDAPAIAA